MSSSTNFATLESAIVSACAKHERENGDDRNYRRCLPFGEYFVKFGVYSSFYPEVVTLNYLADLAKSDASAPQVHHFFHDNGRMAYVVMEYIAASALGRDPCPEDCAGGSLDAQRAGSARRRPWTQGQRPCTPRSFQQ